MRTSLWENHEYHIICMQNIYDYQFHCNIIFLIKIFLENVFNFTFQRSTNDQSEHTIPLLPSFEYAVLLWSWYMRTSLWDKILIFVSVLQYIIYILVDRGKCQNMFLIVYAHSLPLCIAKSNVIPHHKVNGQYFVFSLYKLNEWIRPSLL
jgi:hypothetical protein